MKSFEFSSLYLKEYHIKNIRTDLQFWDVGSVWSTPSTGRINTAIMMPLSLVSLYKFKNGSSFPAYPGDIVFMPKGSIYTCTFHECDDNVISCKHLGFMRSCLFFGFDVFDSIFCEILPQESPQVIFKSGTHDFTQAFIRLCKLRHRPTYTPNQLCIEGMQFINQLSKRLHSIVDEDKDNAFSKIYDYIHDNLETVSAGELVRLTNMSASTLQRRFSEKLGMTPTAYINSMKIEKAKEILESGMTKIKEVSRLCGIQDEFYFSRLFSKYVGMSPTEYLKTIKNNNK